MPEGCQTFLIPGPLGVTRIEASKGQVPYCGDIINEEEIIFSRISPHRPFQPSLPLLYRLDLTSYFEQIARYLDSALEIVESVLVRREQLLRFCLQGGLPAIELAVSCTPLALLAASTLDQIDDYDDYNQNIKSLLEQKRHRMLGRLGFPAERWVVELFTKIPSRLASPLLFDDLKKILHRHDAWQIKILRHLPCLNKLVIDTLRHPFIAVLATPRFYLEACQYPEKFSEVEVYSLLSDLKTLHNRLYGNEIPANLKLAGLSDLGRVHDQLYQHHLDQRRREIYAAIFQEPPIPAKHFMADKKEYGIYPIADGRSLLEESRSMRHCIASYYEELCLYDNLYAYHLTLPPDEQATCLIERYGGQWILLEIRGMANSPASNSAKRFVKQWLDDWNSKWAPETKVTQGTGR